MCVWSSVVDHCFHDRRVSDLLVGRFARFPRRIRLERYAHPHSIPPSSRCDLQVTTLLFPGHTTFSYYNCVVLLSAVGLRELFSVGPAGSEAMALVMILQLAIVLWAGVFAVIAKLLRLMTKGLFKRP